MRRLLLIAVIPLVLQGCAGLGAGMKEGICAATGIQYDRDGQQLDSPVSVDLHYKADNCEIRIRSKSLPPVESVNVDDEPLDYGPPEPGDEISQEDEEESFLERAAPVAGTIIESILSKDE